MAPTASSKALARKRILANAQGRKGTPEAPTEEDAPAAARADEAERILSKRVKVESKRRKPKKGRSIAQIGLLGAIVIAGIAAIIALRNVAEMSGVNWIGD